MPIFLWDVESFPNYTEKLILAGIGTITLMLPTSKLNSSDSQVSGANIFLLPLQERVTPALFKNVMNFAPSNMSTKMEFWLPFYHPFPQKSLKCEHCKYLLSFLHDKSIVPQT
jgi:hypothetical protein